MLTSSSSLGALPEKEGSILWRDLLLPAIADRLFPDGSDDVPSLGVVLSLALPRAMRQPRPCRSVNFKCGDLRGR
jgi:hypothetical protein